MKFNHSLAFKGLATLTSALISYGIYTWQYAPEKNTDKPKDENVPLKTEARPAEDLKVQDQAPKANQNHTAKSQPPKTKSGEKESKPSPSKPTPQTKKASIGKSSSIKPTKTITPADTSLSGQIISLINSERTKNDLPPVKQTSLLNQAAYLKSKDMADKNYFSHTATDGTSDISFVNQVGYKYQTVGINLAEGNFANADELVQAWMNSTGHRQNILADFGQQIGIGIAGTYYTMIIAKPL